ncbi:MAG TPA: hydrogenase expression protein HupH [Thermoanaerobacter sp.]|uniref:aspartate/glutamate racemase family protein n=1 Tax=Thermoanaerobacter sp. A7A TaxID=1350366 RepID=UPI0003F8F03F|nr:aspartate/glutamate racemase family protein [Thermoanaerobacter sp. A7A]MBZ4655501.1 Asp/Glu/hydantoin racemase [Thermoanaerobacter sp.]HHY80811.1 hydrogenase expression protein HupH [Thermoanaerobacter sp.]
MKLKIIVPITSEVFNEEVKKEIKHYVDPDDYVDVENLNYGPASIECEYDEAMAVPDILNKVKKAQEEGFEGIVIDCFGDPGVHAARELVDIPVCGGFEPSMQIALGLGQNIGAVTVLPNVIPMLHDLVAKMGIEKRIKALRYVNIPVLDLGDKKKLEDALFKESLDAIQKENVHVIVLGCTGMMGVANNLMNRLKEAGYDVPVIDPAFAAVRMVKTYIRMGLKHSRLTYMTPPAKPYTWWGK